MRVTQMPATGNENGRQRSVSAQIIPAALPESSNMGLNIKKILSRFEKDDYILAGLIIVLMLEGCDDYILLAALGYLFIMGWKD